MENDLKTISSVLELRIDNLVFNKHKEVHRFTFMDFMNFRHPNMGGNYGFYFIPLTDEWLLKFGFNSNGKVWEIDSINGIVFEIEYVSDCYYLHTQGEWGYQGFSYVHQLQNLYFALTGQELELAK